MEKVLLAKEEVEALEAALEIGGGDKANVVQWHSTNIWDGKQAPLNDLDLDTLCTALYVGYELEESPEEKVLKFYEANAKSNQIEFAVRKTLELLNIQIPGIN
jgi:hypothetical protein